MEDQKIDLHFENPPASGTEIIIRNGEALPLVEEKQYFFSGAIDSVQRFLKDKKDTTCVLQRPRKETSIVEVDTGNLVVKLLVDPNNPKASEVVGKMERSNELAPFNINKPSTFSREQLVKLLRHNKFFFPNKDEYETLLAAYMTFKASAFIDLNAASDTRGNKSASYNKQVNSYGLPTHFVLNAPLFKNQKPVRFQVEVGIEVTDGAAHFWFESPELTELEQQAAFKTFEDIESAAKALDIVVLYK